MTELELKGLLDRNRRALIDETNKIVAATEEARVTKVSLHDGYWKKHYLLRERQRLLDQLAEEFGFD